MAVQGDDKSLASSWDRAWRKSADVTEFDLDSPTLENLIDKAKLNFLMPHLPRRGRAIEIGCGSARLLARLGKALPLELTAADTSPEALNVAAETSRSVGVRIEFTCSDARELPFKSGSCDVVLSGGLLEHFPDPLPVLREMVRILRPGGIFYADVVPRKFSLYRLREAVRMLHSPWLIPGVSESRFGAPFYRRLLDELGCDEIESKYCGVYPPWRARAYWKHARNLDGTLAARLLGWYFMVRARKR